MPHHFIDQTKHGCDKCGRMVLVNTAVGGDGETYTVEDHLGSCVEEQQAVPPGESYPQAPEPKGEPA